MPCLLALLSLFFPRVVIVLLWLLTGYISAPFQKTASPMDFVWPLLGLIFMPFTLLAYVFTINHHGSVDGMYMVLIVIAVLMDLGAIGGGESARRRRVIVRK